MGPSNTFSTMPSPVGSGRSTSSILAYLKNSFTWSENMSSPTLRGCRSSGGPATSCMSRATSSRFACSDCPYRLLPTSRRWSRISARLRSSTRAVRFGLSSNGMSLDT